MAAGGRQLGILSQPSNEMSDHSSKTLCRYYVSGACRLGAECQFSHDRNDRPSNICRYYLRGTCTYGNQCRYDHVKPRPQENSPPTVSTTVSTSSVVSVVASPRADPLVWKNVSEFEYDSDDAELGLVSLNNFATKPAAVGNSSKLRADAKEFVPSWFKAKDDSPFSYAHAVSGGASSDQIVGASTAYNSTMCPYFIMGNCELGDDCLLIHGDVCELCNRAVLHPDNEEMNASHRLECLADHEREMELAFVLAKGEGKQCGICMETVMEKSNPSSRRFGVLPGCKHCFCLECVRKWRSSQQFENKVIRACPECRVKSDFVIPSAVWVEEEDEKRALLEAYQCSMKQKKCKYFRDGEIECPFGNKCFYQHVKPDGTVVQGDHPRDIRRRQQGTRRGRNGSGSSAQVYLLYDFLESRDFVTRGPFLIGGDDDEDDEWLFEFRFDDAFRMMTMSDSDSESD